MSLIPRPHSSPPPPRDVPTPPLASSSSRAMITTRKRKAAADDDEQNPPRKLAAISEESQPNQPLRPTKNLPKVAANRTGLARKTPGLTVPRAPTLTAKTTTTTAATTSTATTSTAAGARRAPPARATSLPPRSTAPLPRPTVRPTTRAATTTRATTSRTVSGPVRGKQAEEQRFQALQAQVTSIAADMEAERTKREELEANHHALLSSTKSQELNQRRELDTALDELEALKRKHANDVLDWETEIKRKERQIRELEEDIRLRDEDLERERETVKTLRATVSQQATAQLTLNSQVTALQAQVTAVQIALDNSSNSAAELALKLEAAERRIAEQAQEIADAETHRRKLHNMVQELKGNIRVFCRVRPLLPSDIPPGVFRANSSESPSGSPSPSPEDEEARKEMLRAQIAFPDKMDHKEIVLRSSSESATGQERKDEWQFTFDRVFEPHSTQAEVFEEISLLAQSCADGYNVCIFAYGQTGSGKSFTMEGGQTESTTGMIPRAVEQVFRVTEDLRGKGWVYRMEGQFLEIYNETINDLLGKGEFDKKKHEIKHDKAGRTSVTDVNVVPLTSPNQVRALLAIAQSRRTVASTLMNERSSRSHSVFTLRICGENAATGETCEGSLNLVDLAGSERLDKSGAGNDKDRLKETQSINKSLSALGDVIAALGEKGDGKGDKHIPYRNSKLTFLLQNSLSGNSKTLMVLNLSPLATHLNESLCSLRFATKVNNTTLGTARKQIKSA